MEEEVEILVKAQGQLPVYATQEAAGADLFAHITESITLLPHQSCCVPTGLYMEIPKGYELQIRPRSGLALKNGITVLNAPGTIDSDYRGNIGVILINHGKDSFIITPNMRIAQAVVAPVVRARFVVAKQLADSSRGEQGFGHTGLH